MENKTKLSFLIVREVTIATTILLSQKFVRENPFIDCIVCCGPFADIENWRTSNESAAIAKGEISSILASLENIVCRVLFLPSENDLPSLFSDFEHLTPNSINLHGRRLQLFDSAFISGYSEAETDLVSTTSDNCNRCHDGEKQEQERSSSGVLPIVEQVLLKGKEEHDSSIKQFGIFVLDYKFAHTLNHFLFHMSNVLAECGVQLCILPKKENVQFPPRIGNLTIVEAPSLRNEEKYVIIEFEKEGSSWKIVNNFLKNIRDDVCN